MLINKISSLEGVKVILSHPQGIAQTKARIQQNIPNAEVKAVSSTAEGARLASLSLDGSVAAIASSAAADVYGLDVYCGKIQESDNNKTRFYALALAPPNKEKSDRILFSAKGNLSSLPKIFKKLNKIPTVLIARPTKRELGEYIFLIEVENAGYKDYLKLNKIEDFDFHYYGACNII